MKKYALILLMLSYATMNSQTIQQVDSLASKMCESFKELKEVKDETKIMMVFEKHLPAFYEEAKVTSQAQADSLVNRVYFRLQRNCQAFLDILAGMEENKSDWGKLAEKPKSKLSKKESDTFFSGKSFYYKEYDGSIVNVALSSSHWIETFEDGTTSNLLIRPKGSGEFELEFLESNNNKRKNFSVKGDVYRYGIYSVAEGIYSAWVATKDNEYHSFRIYTRK